MADVFEIDLTPITRFEKEVGQRLDIGKALEPNVRLAAGVIRKAITDRTPVVTGLLKNSFFVRGDIQRDQIVFTVGTPINYAQPVEDKRKMVEKGVEVATAKATRIIEAGLKRLF